MPMTPEQKLSIAQKIIDLLREEKAGQGNDVSSILTIVIDSYRRERGYRQWA